MSRKNQNILFFHEVTLEDIPLVGGKNAALGEMLGGLEEIGIAVPDGFAVTAHAYREFIEQSNLHTFIEETLGKLDIHNVQDLQKRGKAIRNQILRAPLPDDLQKEIIDAYKKLSSDEGIENLDVAVRSSATAEDLPGASFAGQQETFLNISGEKDLLLAVRKAFASLFTNRAISYREDKGFSHFDVALSVGVQRMVRSDLASSGVAFSIDTESGFQDVVVINSSYGLGEMIVQGMVTPDEFVVFKPLLEKEKLKPIITKTMGDKRIKLVYGRRGTKKERVSNKDQHKLSLSDEEILKIGRWVARIENYFSDKHGKHQPMDVEWAKDGKTNELFIVQARPETVHSIGEANVYREYRLKGEGKEITRGIAVGTKIAVGPTRIMKNAKSIHTFKEGEVLVTDITDPDWEPIMKIASAIVTNKGGRTSHAAIVSRELGIPSIVGSGNATSVMKNGQNVTVDCSSGEEGVVREGKLEFEILEHKLDEVPDTKTSIMVNVGSPYEAFKHANLPTKGVGLGRLEFIIATHVKVHPNALIDYETLKRKRDLKTRKLVKTIDQLTLGYDDKTLFYVEQLAEGIARIAAAFYPHKVIIRLSDFKTNEYRSMPGGELYEPEEENPMLGWRGASRYYDPKFEKAFSLECEAIRKVREEIGLTNVVPMVPFVRTVQEGKNVIEKMALYNLDRTKDETLEIIMMCEIPSNALLADEFLDVFDGLSIGSNDLTQLTLGLDRDSGIIAGIGDERDPSVKKLVEMAIEAATRRNKYIGICGQAPSDYPEFATFLVDRGISSISLNPDVVIPTLMLISEHEKK